MKAHLFLLNDLLRSHKKINVGYLFKIQTQNLRLCISVSLLSYYIDIDTKIIDEKCTAIPNIALLQKIFYK